MLRTYEVGIIIPISQSKKTKAKGLVQGWHGNM